jgi:hypothetical protein
MAIKGGSRRRRQHRKMKRGGDGGQGGQPKTAPATNTSGPSVKDLGDLSAVSMNGNTILELKPPAASGSAQSGGRRRHRHSKKCGHSYKKKTSKRGGGALSTALLPFSLFGIQKLFQKSRKAPTNAVKRMGKYANRTIKRIF